jgi:ribose-phosphate pyrophosphokinase
MAFIFAGSGNPNLAEELSLRSCVILGKMQQGKYSNDNMYIQIEEDVRDKHVFVLQSPTYPVSDRIFEMLLMVDALRRLHPKEIHIITPYFPYSRSDKLDQPGQALAAKLIANCLASLDVSSLITFDLHAKQIEGFFDLPVYHLTAINTLAEYISGLELENVMVLSPDSGGLKRAHRLANILGAPVGFIDKKRVGKDQTIVLGLLGDPRGHSVIICDDEIDTGGSQINAARALIEAGANSVFGVYCHGVLSGDARERIVRSDFERIVVTDTMQPSNEPINPKIEVVSIAEVLAKCIDRIGMVHKRTNRTLTI